MMSPVKMPCPKCGEVRWSSSPETLCRACKRKEAEKARTTPSYFPTYCRLHLNRRMRDALVAASRAKGLPAKAAALAASRPRAVSPAKRSSSPGGK